MTDRKFLSYHNTHNRQGKVQYLVSTQPSFASQLILLSYSSPTGYLHLQRSSSVTRQIPAPGSSLQSLWKQFVLS